MIDVSSLRALRTVAALGSLTRAADDLGYTASAVSQQIKRLEREVGVPVLAPAGRGVVLTAAGRSVVDAAPAVFEALERCTAAARSVAEGTPRGELRIAAFSTGVRGLLAPRLPGLAERCPRLRVLVTERDPDDALAAVDAATADVALVHDADGVPATGAASLARRRVHTDVGDVVVSRTHPLAASGEPLTGADLAGRAWVTSPPGTVCHLWFRRLLADVPEEPDVRHLIDDFATQLALVASGDVIALVPRLARPPVGDGLVVRPLATPPTREVEVVWRRSADQSPAVRALLGALGAA